MGWLFPKGGWLFADFLRRGWLFADFLRVGWLFPKGGVAICGLPKEGADYLRISLGGLAIC